MPPGASPVVASDSTCYSVEDATLLGAIASGSNAQFTVGYTAAGRFSVTRTGSAASDWGIEVFPGIASGALISVAEKTWSSSVITFEVRQNSNALIDPSSLTITMWETL